MWHWINFKTREAVDGEHMAKPHAVHSDLYHPLVCEFQRRGYAIKRARSLDELHQDHGGACIVSMPSVRIEDLGFRWGTWVDELGMFIARIGSLEERRFEGGLPYYKMHGMYNCLVMTPAQRMTLMQAMLREEADAAKQAEAFLKIFRARSEKIAAKLAEKRDAKAGEN